MAKSTRLPVIPRERERQTETERDRETETETESSPPRKYFKSLENTGINNLILLENYSWKLGKASDYCKIIYTDYL